MTDLLTPCPCCGELPGAARKIAALDRMPRRTAAPDKSSLLALEARIGRDYMKLMVATFTEVFSKEESARRVFGDDAWEWRRRMAEGAPNVP